MNLLKTISCPNKILNVNAYILLLLFISNCGTFKNSEIVDDVFTGNYLGSETNSCGIELSILTGGKYSMGFGNPQFPLTAFYYDDMEKHIVELSPYKISTTEISFGIWTNIYIWATNNGYTFISTGDMGSAEYLVSHPGGEDGDHPVADITWSDALIWCNALSEYELKTPCYYIDKFHSNVLKNAMMATNLNDENVVWKSVGYRLPTEAEWEYACRAGTFTTYYFGSEVNSNDANYFDSGDPWDNGTTPIGYFSNTANNFNLYDMHGNISEWCWDWYDEDYYYLSLVTDPKGPADGSSKVQRGGSWLYSQDELTSRNRDSWSPNISSISMGFRIVKGM